MWHPAEAGWEVDKEVYKGHTGSVEDLQWSPSQDDVFGSSSVDKSIRFWDARKGKEAHAVIENAHSSDVNVINWNHKRALLVLSGADDGTVKVWDLRKLGADGGMQPQFSFSWHKQPVSSVEWNPNDDSVFSVGSSDDSVTIWDLSLNPEVSKIDDVEVPSQLLFVHQGQQNIKEVHWHKQIPGVLVSTAADGFCVFKPNNIQ